MEEDGAIYVKIHDQGGASRATWLEEYAHALQFLRDGHVELSVDDSERRERELEVASVSHLLHMAFFTGLCGS